MTREVFEKELRRRLSDGGLSAEEQERSVSYYLEMIEDRMEDGMTEAEAVAALGYVGDLAREILLEAPLAVLMKQKLRPKKEYAGRERTWLIVLAILGAPIWLSLVAAAFSVIVAVYATVFALIVSVFATVIALFLSGVLLIPGAWIILPETGIGTLGIIGAALVLIGIALLLVIPAKWAVLGLCRLTVLFMRGIKALFVGKKKEKEATA